MRDLQEGLHVRPVGPGDADDVVDFLNEVFGAWGNLEDWRWKYQDPPAPFRADSVLAEWDGRIVGHYGMLPVEAMWGGQRVRAAQSVDGAVLPEYRRRGVFTAMAREILGRAVGAGVSLLYAFPGLNSLDLDLQHGYRSVAFVPEMVRVLDVRRAAALALRQLPGDLGALWAVRRPAGQTPERLARVVRLRRAVLLAAGWASAPHVARAADPTPSLSRPLVARKVTAFDARFDALWAGAQHDTALGLCKDARYLTWRYAGHPSCTYTIIVAEEGDRLLGCVVMRQAGLHSRIAELLAAPKRSDVIAPLIAAAAGQAQDAGSLLLSAWSAVGHPLHAQLRRSGFVSPERLHRLAQRWPPLAGFFYQVIAYTAHLSADRQADLIARARAWSLSLGDSDLV